MSLGLGIGIGVPFAGGVSQDYPYSLSANGLLWLRADDAPNPVSSWVDRYGNHTVSQAVGTRQPQVLSNEINGLPAVDGDGANTTGDYLASGNTVGTTLSEYTIWGVVSDDAFKNYGGIYGMDDTPASFGTAQNSLEIWSGATHFTVSHNRNVAVKQKTILHSTMGQSVATYFAFVVTWRVGHLPAFFNNGTLISDETDDVSWIAVSCATHYPTLFISYDANSAFFNGKIAELGMLNTRLTDLTGLWAYLKTRYAIWLSEQSTGNCSNGC